jgi:cysteine synthase A
VVKYEVENPTRRMKDQMALSMMEGAERRSELKTGGTEI